MTTRTAVDLPVGSVIVYRTRTIRRRGPLALPPGWRGDDGTWWQPWEIDNALADGAVIVTIGNGTEG